MELREATEIVESLTAQYMNIDANWDWRWCTSTKKAGSCTWKVRRDFYGNEVVHLVELSFAKNLLPYLTVEAFTDVVLHEIAHARAGHAAAHGPVWQAEAIRVGGTASKYCDVAIPLGAYKVLAVCKKCGPFYGKDRMPAARDLNRYTHNVCGSPIEFVRNHHAHVSA